MCGEKTQGATRRGEHQLLVFKTQTQRQENLPFGIHAAIHALLDAMNRSKSNFRSTGQLGLSHELVLTHLANAIGLKMTGGDKGFCGFGGNGHLRSLSAFSGFRLAHGLPC